MVGVWVVIVALVVVAVLRRGHGVKAIVAAAFVAGLYYGQAAWVPGLTHTVSAIVAGVSSAVSRIS